MDCAQKSSKMLISLKVGQVAMHAETELWPAIDFRYRDGG